MGNKYHVLHRHLSRLSRRDDLGLGVAVPSIHPVSEKTSSRQLVNRGSPPLAQGASPFESAPRFRGWHHWRQGNHRGTATMERKQSGDRQLVLHPRVPRRL